MRIENGQVVQLLQAASYKQKRSHFQMAPAEPIRVRRAEGRGRQCTVSLSTALPSPFLASVSASNNAFLSVTQDGY